MDNLSDIATPSPVGHSLPPRQESYANAIYNSACQKKVVRKQGSYETAVETGASLRISAAKRMAGGKRHRMHKQDSYDNAIGGSFEDEHAQPQYQSPSGRMRKQESYMMAVGEMSPVAEIPPSNLNSSWASATCPAPTARSASGATRPAPASACKT